MEEEGDIPLRPSSTSVNQLKAVWVWSYDYSGDINEQNAMRGGGCGYFEVVVDVEGSATTTSWMLEAGSVSEVINSGLESVMMIPKGSVAQK